MAIRKLEEHKKTTESALMDWGDVTALTGYSETALRRMQREAVNPFPKRRHIPGGGKRFLRAEVVKWMDRLPAVEEDRA
jgi:predicted DNA-binding transcriptional regulator AlpA